MNWVTIWDALMTYPPVLPDPVDFLIPTAIAGIVVMPPLAMTLVDVVQWLTLGVSLLWGVLVAPSTTIFPIPM